MSRVVQKFTLDDTREVITPIQSEYLTANEEDGGIVVYFLVKVDHIDKTMKEKHCFVLQPTSLPFKHFGRLKYLHTFSLGNASMELHLFKNKEPEFTT